MPIVGQLLYEYFRNPRYSPLARDLASSVRYKYQVEIGGGTQTISSQTQKDIDRRMERM